MLASFQLMIALEQLTPVATELEIWEMDLLENNRGVVLLVVKQ